jgi:hypothetical protein
MGQRSTHLVAYAVIDAATNNIPVNGTWYQPTLLTPAGAAVSGNVLPGQVSRMTFSGTGFQVGVDISATPTWATVASAQADALDVSMGGAGKKIAVTSSGAAITTGRYAIYFYA